MPWHPFPEPPQKSAPGGIEHPDRVGGLEKLHVVFPILKMLSQRLKMSLLVFLGKPWPQKTF